MFSNLKNFIKNQKESFVEEDHYSNFSKDNISDLKEVLLNNLDEEYWMQLHHNFRHLFKLSLLKKEVLKMHYEGFTGLTNYRWYCNSEEGLYSVPISRIIKFYDFTTSKTESIELATKHFKSKGETFKDQDIVWKTLDGGFNSFYNMKLFHEKYLIKLINEGEYLDLIEEEVISIYKTKSVLSKKYPEIEKWDIDEFISNLEDDQIKNEETQQNTSLNEGTSTSGNDIELSVDEKNHPKSNVDLYEGKRKYTSITEDKFNKTKTITWNSWTTQPSTGSKLNASAQLGIIWYLDSIVLMGVDEGLGMGMRLIENSKSRLVVIDYEYHRWDWWFLGRGSLSVLIDGDETISLTGKETRNKVYSSGEKGGKIFEKGYWLISESDFKKVCEGKKIEVRINGGSGFNLDFDETHNNDFQFMLRSMFNETYDSNAFSDYINERSENMDKEDKKNLKYGKGCGIVLLVIIVILIIIYNS